jgi:hypothetical protein
MSTVNFQLLDMLVNLASYKVELKQDVFTKLKNQISTIFDKTVNLLELDFAKKDYSILEQTTPIIDKVKYLEALSGDNNSFSSLADINKKISEVKV